jgi:hypothetical protein
MLSFELFPLWNHFHIVSIMPRMRRAEGPILEFVPYFRGSRIVDGLEHRAHPGEIKHGLLSKRKTYFTAPPASMMPFSLSYAFCLSE